MNRKIYLEKKAIVLIPILEIVIGTALLILKIQNVYNYNEFLNNTPKGLLELVEYEIMRYGVLLLWSITILTGCSYWINKKTYWILTQIILCMALFGIGLSLLWFNDIRLKPIFGCLLFLAIFYFFVKIEIKLFNIKDIKSIPINFKIKVVGIVSAIITCVTFFYLEIYLPFQISI